MELGKIDNNFIEMQHLNLTDVVLTDVRDLPVDIYGFYDIKNERAFKRMPDGVAKSLGEGISKLYLDTAGGRIRFCTDSPYVAIKVSFPHISRNSMMTSMNVCGFDLYENFPASGASRYVGSFDTGARPEVENGYEAVIRFGDCKMRYLTLNFPHYSHVDRLLLGVSKASVIGRGMAYANKRPVLFYGSSITQGACASRPGNSYENMISRRFNLDYINLGFSGNAKGEPEIAEYMSGLPMCAFVCDYDHNAPDAPHLLKTHEALYRKIRQNNPEIPYIIMSRPNFDVNYHQSVLRRDAIYKTFLNGFGEGDSNLYYIDGAGIFNGEYEDCCTVDKTHPNDLGFMYIAESISGVIKRAMSDGAVFE